MDEMIEYLMANLREYEKFMKRIDRNLRRQKKINKFTIIAALGFAGYTYFQNKKIEYLMRHMDEIKHTEGE